MTVASCDAYAHRHLPPRRIFRVWRQNTFDQQHVSYVMETSAEIHASKYCLGRPPVNLFRWGDRVRVSFVV